MSAEMVRANAATFDTIRTRLAEHSEDGSVPSMGKMAKLLGGVSRTSMTNMLDGKPVSYGMLASKVMPALLLQLPKTVSEGIRLQDLIRENETARIPTSPDELGKLVFGYYLDHDRTSLGHVQWFKQRLVMGEPKVLGEGRFSFEGTITNDFGNSFAFELTRVSSYLCTLRAEEAKSDVSFAATFTHMHRGVLCGVWCGLNIAWRPTVYRLILSPTELKPKERNLICKAVPVSVGFYPTR